METQPSGMNGKADTVPDETLMMAIVSLNHARNQTVRWRLYAPASESYGRSSRPHFENPWVVLSWENYSSPTSGLAANQVPKPAGLMVHFLYHENVYLKHSPCACHKIQSLKMLGHLHAHSSPHTFTHIYLFYSHQKLIQQTWKLIFQ